MIYRNKHYVDATTELTCLNDKFQMTQCVMMTGVLFGGVLFGRLADRYGRKTPLMIAILIQACTSYVASVLPWYWYFLANWFVLALASGGITIISFVLCLEVRKVR